MPHEHPARSGDTNALSITDLCRPPAFELVCFGSGGSRHRQRLFRLSKPESQSDRFSSLCCCGQSPQRRWPLGLNRLRKNSVVQKRFSSDVGVTGDPPVDIGDLYNLGKQKAAYLP